MTFFKSSTIGLNDLGQVQQEMYDHKLGMLQQECKTRWSSTHAMGDSLMTAQESVQKYCVKEQTRMSLDRAQLHYQQSQLL